MAKLNSVIEVVVRDIGKGDLCERRYIQGGKLELRSRGKEEGTTGERVIVGMPIVYGRYSEILGGGWGRFRETIKPGAATKALSRPDADIRALFNHDSNFVLGRSVGSHTLTLTETDEGVEMEVVPPDTQMVRDFVIAPIERGDVDGMSFSFDVPPDGDSWEEDEEGRMVRTITEISKLYDVGPVTFPAYTDTTAAMRSLDRWRKGNNEKANEEGGSNGGEEEMRDESEKGEERAEGEIAITTSDTSDRLRKLREMYLEKIIG